MGWKEFKESIARALVPEVFVLMEEGTKLMTQLKDKVIEQQQVITELSTLQVQAVDLYNKFIELDKKYTELIETTKINKLSNLEIFCSNKYKVVKNKAYANKRDFLKKPINVYINQMITPDALEVKKLRFRITKSKTLSEDVLNIGNTISNDFTWTSDISLEGTGDYYLYPEEIIVTGKGDCEDHAFVVASLNPEIAVAYGSLTKDGQKIGHAFNVFIENNKLYVLETTGDTAQVSEYLDNDKYYINFIITKNLTFEVDGSVEFGELVFGE